MRNLTILAFAAAASLLVTEPAPASHGASVTGTVLVVDGSGKPIAHPTDVWVYLEDLHPRHRGAAPGSGYTQSISQHNREFDPHVRVVPAGATVWFPNLDSEEHSVFSSTDPAFNLGHYNTDKTGKSQVFADAGEFEIFCDIHKQMWAYVKVVDTTHFTEVQNGAYTLDDVPPGSYNVVAWMPDAREVKSSTLTVTDGGTVTATPINVHPTPSQHTHTHRDGQDYPPY